MSHITRTVALTVAMPIALLGGVAIASSASAADLPKVFVCKFVSTSGVATERLQDGGNPLFVAQSSLNVPAGTPVVIGSSFSDAQTRSIVIGFEGATPTPTLADCVALLNKPPAVNPPAVKPPAVNPPAVNPPAVKPPAVNPPAVNPPAVNPPAVKPPAVNPPAVNPPAVKPPAGLPKSGPPHTGGVGDINPLNGLIALGLLTAGAGVSLSLRRKAGVNRA